MHCCHRAQVWRCVSVTHQADELPVEPAQHVGPLLRLGPEHTQAGHDHRGRLLVE